jgi:TolB protein
MDADGSGLRPVTKGMDDLDGLAWSPDGKKIAHIVDRLGISGPGEQDIHVVNADGSGDRRLQNKIDEVGLSWQPLPRR